MAFNVTVPNNSIKSPAVYNIQKTQVLCSHYKKTGRLFRETNSQWHHTRNKSMTAWQDTRAWTGPSLVESERRAKPYMVEEMVCDAATHWTFWEWLKVWQDCQHQNLHTQLTLLFFNVFTVMTSASYHVYLSLVTASKQNLRLRRLNMSLGWRKLRADKIQCVPSLKLHWSQLYLNAGKVIEKDVFVELSSHLTSCECVHILKPSSLKYRQYVFSISDNEYMYFQAIQHFVTNYNLHRSITN